MCLCVELSERREQRTLPQVLDHCFQTAIWVLLCFPPFTIHRVNICLTTSPEYITDVWRTETLFSPSINWPFSSEKAHTFCNTSTSSGCKSLASSRKTAVNFSSCDHSDANSTVPMQLLYYLSIPAGIKANVSLAGPYTLSLVHIGIFFSWYRYLNNYYKYKLLH